jgi:hypothetical protein
VVTRRVAELLLRLAAGHWPANIRAELHREWTAELHVLATRGRRIPMLRFALSLALSRPGTLIAERRLINRRIRRTAAVLLLAPTTGIAIIVLSVFSVVGARSQLWFWIGGSAISNTPFAAILTGALAVVFAGYAARWARRTALTGPVRIALGIVIPIGLTIGLLDWAFDADSGRYTRDVPGELVWLTGLALVLWGAAVLAGRGRLRAAWCLGILGAIVVADLAVVFMVMDHFPATSTATFQDGAEFVDRISAPMWLFVTLSDWAFGLPRPTSPEIMFIGAAAHLQPFVYLACTPYALAYAISGARVRPVEPVSLAVPSAS